MQLSQLTSGPELNLLIYSRGGTILAFQNPNLADVYPTEISPYYGISRNIKYTLRSKNPSSLPPFTSANHSSLSVKNQGRFILTAQHLWREVLGYGPSKVPYLKVHQAAYVIHAESHLGSSSHLLPPRTISKYPQESHLCLSPNIASLRPNLICFKGK
jgi:hypothetical protein